MLSHLHHFLEIADDADMLTTRDNDYDLNLLDTSSMNNLILGVNTGISINIMDMWKNIHKMTFTNEQTEKNNKLSNPPGNNQISGEAEVLPGQLILIISRKIFLEPGFSYYLDLLLADSDFKTVCYHK